jgi:hypothetical protein
MTQEPEQTFEPVLRLTAQWRRGGAWLGPAWAVLCGIIASAQFQWSGTSIVAVLAGLILAEGLWTTFWAALAETQWVAPLARWRTWQEADPIRPLPYTLPGSDAAQFATVIGQFSNWATRDLWPNYGNALASSVTAPVIALVLSAILGAPVVLLTILAISIPQFALLVCRGNGKPSPILKGLVAITLPILLGFALFKPLSVEIAIVAICYGLAYSGAMAPAQRACTWNLGQAGVLLLLIVTHHPVGAFIVGLLWLPQFLMQAQPSARPAQWWLMASLLVAVASLA